LKAGTALTLVPAQGANTIIVPISCITKHVYGGTNVWSNLPTTSLNYGGIEVIAVVQNPVWTTAGNAFGLGYNIGSDTATEAQCVNLDLTLTLSAALTGNAAGDNTAIVSTKYIIVSV